MQELKQIEDMVAPRKRGDALVHFLLNGTSLEILLTFIFEIMLYLVVDIAKFPIIFFSQKKNKFTCFITILKNYH